MSSPINNKPALKAKKYYSPPPLNALNLSGVLASNTGLVIPENVILLQTSLKSKLLVGFNLYFITYF